MKTEELEKLLQDPNAVYTNMLRGTIARPKCLLDLSAVQQAIEQEPELPGEIPASLYFQLRDNPTTAQIALRATVKTTKENILKRITALAACLVLYVGCSTEPNPQMRQVAADAAVAIRANVPRDIAKARERGPEAVAKVERQSQRWLLGTSFCSTADRAALAATLRECLAYEGSYADAEREFAKDRWQYLTGMIAHSDINLQPGSRQ